MEAQKERTKMIGAQKKGERGRATFFRTMASCTAVMTLLAALSCGGGGDDDVPPEVTNGPPGVPVAVFPDDGLFCTAVALEFTWGSVEDPDGDSVEYRVEVSREADFSTVDFTELTAATSQAFDLERGTVYHWRVAAIDDGGSAGNPSPARSFTTEPEAVSNTIPTTPRPLSPKGGEVVAGTTVELVWESTDKEGDALVFDLYFGTADPPPLFGEGLTEQRLEVALTSGALHHWRVVVRDANNNAAIGPVERFRSQ